MVEASIVNVVATAALGQRVDLDELGKLSGILHDSDIYGGRVAYFRSPKIKGVVSIFASGKMISVGTKSEEEAICELECAKEFLVENGFVKHAILKPKIQNIVVVANLGESIELEEVAKRHKMVYEPEQFPGAIFRITEPCRASILLFASGKIVIAGLKRSDEIPKVLNMVLTIVSPRPL